MVEWLFLAVPWGCLFPDHTHLLFLLWSIGEKKPRKIDNFFIDIKKQQHFTSWISTQPVETFYMIKYTNDTDQFSSKSYIDKHHIQADILYKVHAQNYFGHAIHTGYYMAEVCL